MIRSASNNSTVAPKTNMTSTEPPLTREEMYKAVMEAGFDLDQVFLKCKFWSDNYEEIIPCRDIVRVGL